jgi:NitT/TauT family transport system substrate-binding protein
MNKILIFLIALLLVATACTTQQAATGQVTKELTTVKIGHLPAVQGLPLYLALDKGYFEQEGIKVEVTKFDSPNLLLQALASGQIDFGAPSTAAGITSIVESQKPGELKIFALGGSSTQSENAINEVLIVRKDSSISTMQDLKGKKVGILASIQWRTIAKHIFAQQNLSTEKDIILVELAPGLQAQALAAGQVDALLAIEPIGTTARVNGISKEVIHAPVEQFVSDPFYGGAGVLRTSFAKENPQTTEKVLRVFAKSIDEINANPQVAKSHLVKYTPLNASLANEVPNVIFKMYPNFTAEDKQGLQQFFDIFWQNNVTTKRVDVDQIIYKE